MNFKCAAALLFLAAFTGQAHAETIDWHSLPPDADRIEFFGMVRNEVATRYPRLTVNGLALLGAPDVKVDLLEYFENQVIFGPDSFAIAVEDPGNAERFTEGLEKKLFKELVG